MKGLAYFKKKIPEIIFHLIILILFSLILIFMKLGIVYIFAVILGYTILLGIYLFVDYTMEKRKFQKYNSLINSLDKKYLFPELISDDFTDEEWIRIINRMSKSMAEEVNFESHEKEVYKEYIEIMIHEIKNPLATINLISSNNKSEVNRKILSQTEIISNLIEQALYLAKLENLERDYHITSISLNELVNSAIEKNRVSLLENGFGIELIGLERKVFTDMKWFVFILSQIISNSIKYSKGRPKMIFIANVVGGKIVLSIEDNGVGFADYERKRAFEKGFTGEQSENLNSTGMGLYIVKELCNRLNIKVENENSDSGGAKIIFEFPNENFERQL